MKTLKIKKIVTTIITSLLTCSMLAGCQNNNISKSTTYLSDETEKRAALEELAAFATTEYISAKLSADSLVDSNYNDSISAGTDYLGIIRNFEDANEACMVAMEVAKMSITENSKGDLNKSLSELNDALGMLFGYALGLDEEDFDLDRTEDSDDKEDDDYADGNAEKWVSDIESTYDEFPAEMEIYKYCSILYNDSKKARDVYADLYAENNNSDMDASSYIKLAKKAAKEYKEDSNVDVYVSGLSNNKNFICNSYGVSDKLNANGGLVINGSNILVDIGTSDINIVVGQEDQIAIKWSDFGKKLNKNSTLAVINDVNEELFELTDDYLSDEAAAKFDKMSFIASDVKNYKKSGYVLCANVDQSMKTNSINLTVSEFKTKDVSGWKLKRLYKKAGAKLPKTNETSTSDLYGANRVGAFLSGDEKEAFKRAMLNAIGVEDSYIEDNIEYFDEDSDYARDNYDEDSYDNAESSTSETSSDYDLMNRVKSASNPSQEIYNEMQNSGEYFNVGKDIEIDQTYSGYYHVKAFNTTTCEEESYDRIFIPRSYGAASRFDDETKTHYFLKSENINGVTYKILCVYSFYMEDGTLKAKGVKKLIDLNSNTMQIVEISAEKFEETEANKMRNK